MIFSLFRKRMRLILPSLTTRTPTTLMKELYFQIPKRSSNLCSNLLLIRERAPSSILNHIILSKAHLLNYLRFLRRTSRRYLPIFISTPTKCIPMEMIGTDFNQRWTRSTTRRSERSVMRQWRSWLRSRRSTRPKDRRLSLKRTICHSHHSQTHAFNRQESWLSTDPMTPTWSALSTKNSRISS